MQELKITVATLATMMAGLIPKMIKKKKKTLDSGADMSVTSDLSHLDSKFKFKGIFGATISWIRKKSTFC